MHNRWLAEHGLLRPGSIIGTYGREAQRVEQNRDIRIGPGKRRLVIPGNGGLLQADNIRAAFLDKTSHVRGALRGSVAPDGGSVECEERQRIVRGVRDGIEAVERIGADQKKRKQHAVDDQSAPVPRQRKQYRHTPENQRKVRQEHGDEFEPPENAERHMVRKVSGQKEQCDRKIDRSKHCARKPFHRRCLPIHRSAGAYRKFAPPVLYQQEAEQHPAQMSEIGDAGLRACHGSPQFQHAVHDHKPFRLDRNRK